MKLCPYCGTQYADEIERCAIDNEILPRVPERTKPPVLPDATKSASVLVSIENGKSFNSRQLLILEVLLVCVVVFGSSLIASTYHFFYGYGDPVGEPSSSPIYSWLTRMERELAGLGLVWYLLLRRGKSFKNLGLVWLWRDLGWTVLLIFTGSLAFKAIYEAIYLTGMAPLSRHADAIHVGDILFGGGVSYVTILFQFVNPFFEELIVRAYLMTEIKFLTRSSVLAILVSTILQTSYHFYQGAPAAFGHAGTFLIFSIFYAKTNRITPVIFAHLYSDVGATLWYLMRQ